MELSEHLQKWRAERPDEWKMDEFIREAINLENENFALAAGQCIVEQGLLGDEYGNQYCDIQAKLQYSEMDLQNQTSTNKQLQSKLTALQEERDKYKKALEEASNRLYEAGEEVLDWGAYANPYFQQKHSLKESAEVFSNAAANIDKLLMD